MEKRGNRRTRVIDFEAEAGFYEVSIICDARNFDYSTLYFPMDRYGNSGQRTGPWDFDLRKGNVPLVPSYWLELDGEPLGLWYFRRPSLEDLKFKIFRGRAGVRLVKAGRHSLKLRSYGPNALPWIRVNVGKKLSEYKNSHPSLSRVSLRGRLPVSYWGDRGFWRGMALRLEGERVWLKRGLFESLNWAVSSEKSDVSQFPLLLAAHGLTGNKRGLSKATDLIEDLISRPAWGNPDPAGYGHNGDLLAASQMQAVAWALHAFSGKKDLCRRIKAKLKHQGELFFKAALLNEDYWGGSLLQDHGWRSFFTFADASLHLVGILPEAGEWFDFAIRRIGLAIEAMPRDGGIPWSSYGFPYLYLDAPSRLRETLLARVGRDLYDIGRWTEIIAFVETMLAADRRTLLFPGANQDDVPLIGGAEFFFQLAEKTGNPAAARLGLLAATVPEPVKFYGSTQRAAFHLSKLWALLAPLGPRPEKIRRRKSSDVFAFFPDTGYVRWQEPVGSATFLLRCAPISGWHANRHAGGPCDRMQIVSDGGHFSLWRGSRPMLASPEHGYRLRTATRSCLLINGKGQVGDVGYPMSVPAFKFPGHEIENAVKAGESYHVTLDLTAAYPEECGVVQYLRTFVLGPGPGLVCRDDLTLSDPARLQWLFHMRACARPRLRGLQLLLGEAPLRIRPVAPRGVALSAALGKTDVVWSYDSASQHAPCMHVRYEASCPVRSMTMNFEICWKERKEPKH